MLGRSRPARGDGRCGHHSRHDRRSRRDRSVSDWKLDFIAITSDPKRLRLKRLRGAARRRENVVGINFGEKFE
jgi:hypothetical protein